MVRSNRESDPHGTRWIYLNQAAVRSACYMVSSFKPLRDPHGMMWWCLVISPSCVSHEIAKNVCIASQAML